MGLGFGRRRWCSFYFYGGCGFVVNEKHIWVQEMFNSSSGIIKRQDLDVVRVSLYVVILVDRGSMLMELGAKEDRTNYGPTDGLQPWKLTLQLPITCPNGLLQWPRGGLGNLAEMP
ncbi:hypothetical protein OUZ56_022720 [Daphnia magna]|uniref:Uncharacterized protein n=1 Tax=Daphnia magna TaxID=35525 RepID=A0ABR0AX97_9CRUS|nr:hypothetical protein OUZ56_022720 [Daphnia magna]